MGTPCPGVFTHATWQQCSLICYCRPLRNLQSPPVRDRLDIGAPARRAGRAGEVFRGALLTRPVQTRGDEGWDGGGDDTQTGYHCADTTSYPHKPPRQFSRMKRPPHWAHNSPRISGAESQVKPKLKFEPGGLSRRLGSQGARLPDQRSLPKSPQSLRLQLGTNLFCAVSSGIPRSAAVERSPPTDM